MQCARRSKAFANSLSSTSLFLRKGVDGAKVAWDLLESLTATKAVPHSTLVPKTFSSLPAAAVMAAPASLPPFAAPANAAVATAVAATDTATANTATAGTDADADAEVDADATSASLGTGDRYNGAPLAGAAKAIAGALTPQPEPLASTTATAALVCADVDPLFATHVVEREAGPPKPFLARPPHELAEAIEGFRPQMQREKEGTATTVASVCSDFSHPRASLTVDRSVGAGAACPRMLVGAPGLRLVPAPWKATRLSQLDYTTLVSDADPDAER